MENAQRAEVPRARIALVGAGGFIGARLGEALSRAGFPVRPLGRGEVDFCRAPQPQRWRTALQGTQVLVNAAGIFNERGACGFEAAHVHGPRALFDACAALGIAVIQVSALGADAGAQSRFHASKREADDALLALGVPCIVLQPSLVYGRGGASATLFDALAALPLIPLPGRGDQRLQPVHVDDVACAVVNIVRRGFYPRERLALVGPRALTLREYLAELRRGMGLGEARFLPVPERIVSAAAALGGRFGGMLDAESWRMLRRGNTGDAAPLAALLGRPPRPAGEFITPETRRGALRDASLAWLLPLLRLSIALVWLGAALVSAGLYPVAESRAMLARVGLSGHVATLALYGAVALDAALGFATLLMRKRRALWMLQIGVILLYSLTIAFALPEQWLHPFGPMLKNLPLLAALLLLWRLEPR